EEDGVNYVDEFPVEFDVFDYVSEEVYNSQNSSPVDTVIDIIVSNNLLPEILDTNYVYPDYKEHYQFITINRAINALKDKGIDITVTAELIENKLVIEYDEN